jgi:lipoteichoic acid synthase
LLRFARFALVGLAAAALASCGRAPAPPYPLSFAFDGPSPRFLETSQEITVPVALTNSGPRAWDPARVHLSYHWLWIVPREVATRSRWNVPFQNGIRTDLDGPTAPGARVNVDGRVLAPAWPGVYWLQWDMVEEGVAWFAQVSPRQPRTLVLVVPPLASDAAPLPLLAALVGLVVLARRRKRLPVPPALDAYAGAADVVWCAVVLTAKPLVVLHDALLEPTPVAYWLIVLAGVVPPVAAWLVLPRRGRVWTLVSMGVVGSLVVLGDVIYYRFFGDVLSAPALLGAHQAGHVWGSIRSLLSPGLVWLVADWPVAIWLGIRLSRGEGPTVAPRRRLIVATAVVAALAAGGLALSAPRVLASTDLAQMFRDRSVVEQLGLFGFHGYDGWNYARSTWLRPPVDDADVRDALSWFTARAPLRAGTSGAGAARFGAARGRNLIVVQVESLQDFVVDFRVRGQEVMPHLHRWSDDSLRFTNVTDETSEGRTSDAEFTTMTSLLPLDHGAVAFRYPGNHYTALPRVLADQGYRTLSAVAFESGFWNRGVMHPSYGFAQSLFEPDFELTDQIGWGLNDRDFLQQMVPRLERLPRPFAAWLITLSLHHPFEDFPDRHKTLDLGTLDRSPLGNYLHAMRFFDDALEQFKTALARNGLLDSSVVVVFGDHDAGFPRDSALARAIGIDADEAAWSLNDRVPLFVRVPAPVGEWRGTRGDAAGQTDVAPTLLALLGVDPAKFPYVGRNLLGAPGAGPVPRPYGDWLDAQHLFLTRRSTPACYDLARRIVAADACREGDREARRERDVSHRVVTEDLQQRLRAMMAMQ